MKWYLRNLIGRLTHKFSIQMWILIDKLNLAFSSFELNGFSSMNKWSICESRFNSEYWHKHYEWRPKHNIRHIRLSNLLYLNNECTANLFNIGNVKRVLYIEWTKPKCMHLYSVVRINLVIWIWCYCKYIQYVIL